MAEAKEYFLSWPPSQNALWRAYNGRNILSAQGRQWYKTAADELLCQRARPIKGPVVIQVDLAAPTRREYDPDNKVKALFDSLVKSGIIEDDSNRIIKRHSVSVDGESVGAKVTIIPFGGNIGSERIGLCPCCGRELRDSRVGS